MAVLWWVLLWCHHAQQIVHANESFPWTTNAKEWMPAPTPTPLSTTSPGLPSTSFPSAVSSLAVSAPADTASSSPESTSSLPFSPSTSSTSFSVTTLAPSPDVDKADEEGSKAALNFLHSGDHLLLSEANCSKSFELTDLQGPPPETLLSHIRGPQDSLLHATNFLNMIFQASDMRESSIKEDMEWYHALVRSLAGGQPNIRRALLSLTAHPMSSKPLLLLRATKKGHEILLQDLSSDFYHGRHKGNWGSWDNFHASSSLTKAILLNDLRSLDTPKWSRGDSYIVDLSHVRWSKPFLECEGGHFLQGWMISLSTAFYGLKPDLSPEFKGTLRVDVQLLNLGIDQCAKGPGWFANSHSCDENSTQVRRTQQGVYAVDLYTYTVMESRNTCHCRNNYTSFVSRIRASGLILLETILFGSLLLYFPVFILYFKPSVFRCVALRWVRLLGFCIVYGTIVLKLYRVMKVFLSRTAQRVPYLTSMRLLRMLFVFLLFCIWFLVGWTVGALENLQRGVPVVIRTQTREGLVFYTCDHDRWDYMMSIAEVLFLCWGSFLCYGARSIPSAFHEPRYMGIAIHNEMIVSAAFHVLRFLIVPSLHPDWTLLLFFIHTHGTVTMTLTLLFIPKFLHAGVPPREEIATEVYEDELDMRRSRSNLNSSITSAWSEHSLDPDDIRDELKKLYAQLEVHKTKKMTINNPHLQKKRSSRRGLGRSIMRRITETPDSANRQSTREDKEGSPGSSGGQRRKQQDSGSVKQREESLRQRVLSLRKSHSTYDHMQECKDAGPPSPRESSTRDPSLRDSVMRRNLARNVSMRSRGDSLCHAPLVCKSLSAHNLLADKKPLSVRPGPLQKSHSVMGSGKGPLVGAADIMAERTMEGSRNPLLGGSFDKAEVCPWEVQELPPPSESRSQKHVTYAPGKCSSLDSSLSSEKTNISRKRGDIGSKHHSVGGGEEIKSPSHVGNKYGQSQGATTKQDTDPSSVTVKPGTGSIDSEGLKTKASSLKSKDTAEKNADTLKPLHKSTLKSLVLAVRAFKGKELKDKGKQQASGEGSPLKNKMEEICPWETQSNNANIKNQKPDVLNLSEKGSLCPSPKQDVPKSNKRKEETTSPNPTTKEATPIRKLERMSQLRDAVCPWESMEGPQNVTHKSNSVESRRSEICPWESTDSEGPGGLLSQSGSNLSFPSPSTKVVKGQNGGEWEGEQRSQKADICPWEAGQEKDPKTEAWRAKKAVSLKEQVCPWEDTKEEKPRSEICPWETSDVESVPLGGISGRSLAIKLEELGRQRDAVCPWESEESGGSPGPLSQSHSKTFDASLIKSKTSDSIDLEARRGEICPWESLDSEGTPAVMSQSQSHTWEPASKELGEPCPKMSPQPNKACQGRMSQSKQNSLCSLSSEDTQPLSKILSKSEGRIGDLYFPATPTPHTKRWQHSLREQRSGCTGELRFSVSQQQGHIEQSTAAGGGEDTGNLADICPWEVQEKPTESQANTRKSEVCPWDFQ
eukprot:XP_012808128.1 PREDICTED: probable G-protein coupled receptor 179 [Xenopus tropicalis]